MNRTGSSLEKTAFILTEPYSEDSEFKTEIVNLKYLDRPDAEVEGEPTE